MQVMICAGGSLDQCSIGDSRPCTWLAAGQGSRPCSYNRITVSFIVLLEVTSAPSLTFVLTFQECIMYE
jgi:hypothetical protein